MKRVVIICEGETEQEFCNKTLSQYFTPQEIFLQAPLIKHSNGGIVKWSLLKKQIEITLKEDPTVIVTMLIDYYGLYQKYQFPKWDEALNIPNKSERMDFLENAMYMDVEENLRHRFMPYIQLHEFEGLLFCDVEIFKQQIPANELIGVQELIDVISAYPNPEDINTTPDTSPSHRLIRIIQGYNKIVYGDILADAIGLQTIRQKCPRFNQWIHSLETKN